MVVLLELVLKARMRKARIRLRIRTFFCLFIVTNQRIELVVPPVAYLYGGGTTGFWGWYVKRYD